MAAYNTPFKSASSRFEPRGVYFGVIKAVDGRRLSVTIPRLTGSLVFENVEFVDSDFTTAPQVGERVFITFKEGRQDDPVVLGRMSSSLSTPYVNVDGAASGDTLRFNGTEWYADDFLSGGLEDQIIAKASDADYDFEWIDNFTSDLRFTCKNDSGATIAANTPVMATGAVGDVIRIAPAVSDGSVESEYMLGVTFESIANGSEGYVVLLGPLKHFNSAAYTIGTLLYIDPASPGTLTSTKPTAPAIDMPIAIVTKQHASNGRIYVRMWSQGQKLGEIYDVSLTSPASGDVLRYNGTVWINDPINLSTDTVGNYVATIAGTANQISVSGSGSEGAEVTLSLPSPMTVPGNLNITGNLTVNGTTTTVNSTTVTIDDPIFTLGGDTAPTTDDNKDRGIEFRYHDGSSAKVGFFGLDDSTGKFTFLTNATNTSEVFSGTKGEVDAQVDWSNLINKDEYISDITSGTGVTVTGTPSAGATFSVAIGQSVAASATPSFASLTLTQPTGTAPLTISSTTLVPNLNADLLDGQHASFYMPSGSIHQYAGLTAPSGWLFCDGSSVSRSTYADLFSVITSSKGTATMTIASPCVVTNNSHGLVAGDAVYFTTTGALPTGLTANTTYYVQNPATNTFNLNTSQSNAIANSSTGRVNTSGSQSGTHTLVHAPWGGITATNFAVPDLRGRIPVGLDNMGGSDAGRLDVSNALGSSGGEQTHLISGNELPLHTHSNTINNGAVATSNHTHTEGSLQAAAGAVNNDSGSYWYNAGNPRVGGRGPTATGAYVLYGMASTSFSGYVINHWTNVYGYTDGPGSTATVGITNGNNTSNTTPMNVMQPYILLNYIIKI